jgi:hypothetical protein
VTDVWKLFAGDDLVADLVVTGLDDPWLLARVEPGPALDRYRPLFEAELRDDFSHGGMRRALRLRRPDGADVAPHSLHIDGDEAWWRWTD